MNYYTSDHKSPPRQALTWLGLGVIRAEEKTS